MNCISPEVTLRFLRPHYAWKLNVSMSLPELLITCLGGIYRPPSILTLTDSRRVARATLTPLLMVGTVLNVINCGQQFRAHSTLTVWQMAMDFPLPFCASNCSAARNQVQRAGGG